MNRICPICQKEYKSRKIVDDILRDFPEDKDKWIAMECPDNSTHFKILRDREMAKISKETKQKILDLMHHGKSVGDVGKILKLDIMIVAEIIIENIENISFLRREAK